MGFRKLRIAPISSYVSDDGYPVYGEFVKLQDAAISEELNSVEITINNVTKSRTLQADDKEDVKTVSVRAEGSLKIYGCTPESAEGIFGYKLDANKNVIEVMNGSERKRYGVFFEGKTAREEPYQKYFYDVEFGEPSTYTASTDTGEDAPIVEIPFNVRFLDVEGKSIRSATIYPGNTGWISGEPTVMYKEAKAGVV